MKKTLIHFIHKVCGYICTNKQVRIKKKKVYSLEPTTNNKQTIKIIISKSVFDIDRIFTSKHTGRISIKPSPPPTATTTTIEKKNFFIKIRPKQIKFHECIMFVNWAKKSWTLFCVYGQCFFFCKKKKNQYNGLYRLSTKLKFRIESNENDITITKAIYICHMCAWDNHKNRLVVPFFLLKKNR